MTEWPPIFFGWCPFTQSALHPFLPVTTSFDHGCEFPTTEKSGEHSRLVGCGDRGRESSEGDVESDTSQGRLRDR